MKLVNKVKNKNNILFFTFLLFSITLFNTIVYTHYPNDQDNFKNYFSLKKFILISIPYEFEKEFISNGVALSLKAVLSGKELLIRVNNVSQLDVSIIIENKLFEVRWVRKYHVETSSFIVKLDTLIIPNSTLTYDNFTNILPGSLEFCFSSSTFNFTLSFLEIFKTGLETGKVGFYITDPNNKLLLKLEKRKYLLIPVDPLEDLILPTYFTNYYLINGNGETVDLSNIKYEYYKILEVISKNVNIIIDLPKNITYYYYKYNVYRYFVHVYYFKYFEINNTFLDINNMINVILLTEYSKWNVTFENRITCSRFYFRFLFDKPLILMSINHVLRIPKNLCLLKKVKLVTSLIFPVKRILVDFKDKRIIIKPLKIVYFYGADIVKIEWPKGIYRDNISSLSSFLMTSFNRRCMAVVTNSSKIKVTVPVLLKEHLLTISYRLIYRDITVNKCFKCS